MFHFKNCSIMQNKIISLYVHSEFEAYKQINMLSDDNLVNIRLNCYVDDVVYSMYYDVEKSLIRFISFPFVIMTQDIRQAFKDAVFAIYHV